MIHYLYNTKHVTHPGSAVGKSSVLAHACVWLVDEPLIASIWDRVVEAGLPDNCR